MTTLIPAVLDTAQIRRTYAAVLVMGVPCLSTPNLGDEEHRAHLAGLLRGQLQLLVQVVGGEVTEMQGETQLTAEHVLKRARDELEMDVREAREPNRLEDLARLTRCLLSLHGLPRAR
jgi:hypothetical protein